MCAVLRRPSRGARCYAVPPDVRARRRVEPAAIRRPPARKSRSSRPPDTPPPPALGSSSGGIGVGVDVAVDVGTVLHVEFGHEDSPYSDYSRRRAAPMNCSSALWTRGRRLLDLDMLAGHQIDHALGDVGRAVGDAL